MSPVVDYGTVTYETGDGSPVASVGGLSFGDTVARPAPDPVRDGYAFGGWYADAACTDPYDFAGGVTGSFILYAKWTAQGPAPGDLNEDGFVNAKDVTLLRRFIAGGYGVTLTENAADVNRDGVVDAKDVTFLRRCITGGYGITLE